MDFTFGIITAGDNDNFINIIIKSIQNNNIPNYEIIIVGNTKVFETDKITVIKFDESIYNGWITKKKNIIAENAKYENIVLLHDYVKLNDNWYQGYLKFGNEFHYCINPIINLDGNRYRDYMIFPGTYRLDHTPVNIDKYFGENCLLPYDFENNLKTNKYMSISGAYYVIKKKVALIHKLDERLMHNQGEDVELSKRLHRNGIIIQCNKFSSVTFLKYKESVHWEKLINETMLDKYIEFCKNE